MELLFVACNRISSGRGLLFTEIGSERTGGAFAGGTAPTAIASWFTTVAWEVSALLSCGHGCGDKGNEKAGPESAAPPANACGATLPTASGLVLPGDTRSGTRLASGCWNETAVFVPASAKPASAEADLRPDEPDKSGSRAGGRAGCVSCATRTGRQIGIPPFAVAAELSFRPSFVFVLVLPAGTIPLPGFRDGFKSAPLGTGVPFVAVDESSEAQVDAKLPVPLCTTTAWSNKLDTEWAGTMLEIMASVTGITATVHGLSGCSRCTYAPQSPRIIGALGRR